MCGIGGYYRSDGGAVLKNQILSINSAQAHRGPDDEGLWIEGAIGLANSRLSIIDLSPAGHMPMTSEDGSVTITYNGEVYNHLELRSYLESKGHRFKSNSDTEVVLRLYLEHGAGCLALLRGMYALAIFDRTLGELLLARDPYGIKPLVYAELPHAFAFASEVRALMKLPGLSKEADWTALSLYLVLNYIPAPWSSWKGVRKLLPGHFLRVREGRVVECRSYCPPQVTPWQAGEEEAIDALQEALKESVRLHQAADVPVGVFLSGGLDSSLIAAIAVESSSEPVHTFTVKFPDFQTFDESPQARRVAEFLNTDHEEISVSATEAQEAIPEVLDHLDEPFADPALVPSAILSRVTRSHVKVALSGDGGDELFGGYNKYLGLNYARNLAPLGPILRLVAQLPLRFRSVSPFDSFWQRFKKLSYITGTDILESSVRAMSVFPPEELVRLVKNETIEGHNRVKGLIGDLIAQGRKVGLKGINLPLYADTHFVLPYDMLHKIDTASMRYGLEVRVPLVDPQVAGLAQSFPETWKVHRGQRKRILYKVAQRYFPNSVLGGRRKHGFDIPLGEWLRQGSLPEIAEVLSPSQVRQGGVFHAAAVSRLLKEHMDGRNDHFSKLWNIYVFERWRQRLHPVF